LKDKHNVTKQNLIDKFDELRRSLFSEDMIKHKYLRTEVDFTIIYGYLCNFYSPDLYM